MALAVWLAAAGGLLLVDGTVPVGETQRFVATSLMLSAFGVVLGALIARPSGLRRSLVRLQLGPWVCVSFAVVYGLASLIWLVPASIPGDEQRAAVDPAYLVPALLVVAAGLSCFCLGYRAAPRALRRTAAAADAALSGAPGREVGARSVLALWGIAVLAQAGSIRTGSFGYLADPQAALAATSSVPAVLALFGNLGLLASLLAGWRHAVSRTPSSLVLLLFVLLSQLALGLFSGMKEQVIIQVFAAAFGYGLRRRVRLAPILVAGAVFVVFVVPFVTQYRVAVLAGSGRLAPSDVVAVVGLEDLLSASEETSVAASAEQLADRLARVGDVAVVLQKTPAVVPYRSPVDLASSPFLGMVPRSLWPGKPVLDAGYVMSTEYYGLPADVYTSSAMTPYGDLWRHGGIWVLVLGMAGLGMLVRSVDDRPGDPATDPRLLFLPMLLFTPLVKQEIDYLNLMASLVTTVVATTVASRVVAATSGGPGRRRGDRDVGSGLRVPRATPPAAVPSR
ncbi:hypothetical protein [Geodermatophilus sp. CPCC 205506]|uniref:hypothetical protein n=1 Tax=Geodermatophilus sp. CPCC 205506 TaxID=2936596 RepID=UPI003EF04BBC